MSGFCFSIMLLMIAVNRGDSSKDFEGQTCNIGSVGTCSIRRNCGLPKLTAEQLECLRSPKTAETIRRLNITGPRVIEGVKFVEMTVEQEEQLVECYGDSLLQPKSQQRRKRQADGIRCCQEENHFVVLTHTAIPGMMVEIVQTGSHAQTFEHANSCPAGDICGSTTTCTPQPLNVVAVVVSIDPPTPDGFMITNINVNTCRTFRNF